MGIFAANKDSGAIKNSNSASFFINRPLNSNADSVGLHCECLDHLRKLTISNGTVVANRFSVVFQFRFFEGFLWQTFDYTFYFF
ncbi:hypothetical protein EBQ74_02480 [bacterium]|nr:hypothetical protein [bacterium]